MIVLIDNDDGATRIFHLLQSKRFGITINHATDQPFYYLGGPLYLIKTPTKGADNNSCSEDFFHEDLLAKTIDGKTFNRGKESDAPGKYGKVVFAERVVRPHASGSNCAGFDPLLKRIEAVLDDYAKRKAAAPAPAAPVPAIPLPLAAAARV